jgi:hypothetical protein
MKRVVLLFLGLSALLFGANSAKAVDTVFEWKSSNGFGGSYTEWCATGSVGCTNGASSTWSGDFFFDTTLGTQNSTQTSPAPTLSFVGIANGGSSPPSLNFGTFGGACATTAACGTMVGSASFQPLALAPTGTTFELIMCDNACSTPSVEYWVFDVAATYSSAFDSSSPLKNLITASVLGGEEVGGECTNGYTPGSSPTSGATCGYIGATATLFSTTPLPATLPLFGTGLLGLWACARRRKARTSRTA